MQMLDLDKFDPAVRDKGTGWLMLMSSSMATWFFPAERVLKWHGDLRIYAAEDGYQRLVTEGPPVPIAEQNGFMRVALKGEALDQYRRQFDKWLGRETW